MRFPIKGKDIIELGMEDCDINALRETFQDFFDETFESIEYYRKNTADGTDFLSKKKFYDASGFIDRIEFYDSKGNSYKIIHFEKTPLEIKSQSQATYSATKEVWRFNQLGNLINVRSEYGNNYFFHYDEQNNLESVNEGFKFKWQNEEVSELIDASNDSTLQKVINKSAVETTMEFIDEANENQSGIRTFKYDDLGRLISIASHLASTTIKYETKGNTSIKTSTSYFNKEQISFSSSIEKTIAADKIEIEVAFQEEKDSPILKSRIVKNKRRKMVSDNS